MGGSGVAPGRGGVDLTTPMEPNDPQTEAFFQSVGEAFAKNREEAARFELVLVAIVLLLAVMQVVAFVRRARGLKLDAQALAHQRGLTKDERELALALARAAGVPPMELLTHLDVFEAVTKRALLGELEVFLSGEPLAASLRRIRHALHFDRLPAHAPLLTTRELSPGLALEVGDAHAQVAHVDEATFSVELRAPVSCAVGDAVQLRLSHAREARYELTCRVREVKPATDVERQRVTLAHDEAPRRLQQREYARVAVKAPVTLRALSWPGHSLARRELAGELQDVSGGGARVSSAAVLPAGVLLEARFSVAGEAFCVQAVSLSTQRAGVAHEVHLEFKGLLAPERERLIAAVAKLEKAAQAAARAG